MGGLVDLFELDNRSMARKVGPHKKHVDGLEAPRNSLDFRTENAQAGFAVGELSVDENWAGKNCYPFEAPMKKLINNEISKNSSTRQNSPSIVARLMGMDIMTSDSKSVVHPIEKRNEVLGTKYSNKEANGSGGSYGNVSANSSSSRPARLDTSYYNCDAESNYQISGKPRIREHPQEEELQKFKKEFKAWQAARFRECSRFVELGGGVSSQLLAQEDLNKVKSNLYAKPPRRSVSEKPVKSKGHTTKSRSVDLGCSLQHHAERIEPVQIEQRKTYSSRNKIPSRDLEQCTTGHNAYSVPTRIVILKPGPDRLCGNNEQRDSWSSSPCNLEQRGSIEDFLEEVRERLKCEMQGKMIKKSGGSAARGSGIETPYSERPSDPKEIAQTIAKHARESASREIGLSLVRSESTRSYRSETEFISRDTRRLVSERLKNVVKRETTDTRKFVGSGHSRSYSLLDLDSNRKRGDEVSNFEIVKDEREVLTRSFRHGIGELSPRNLVRSLSAPVSGTSFGKLLLEDRHILTGAQIRRKLEGAENAAPEINKQRKKEKFTFKEKVSNFRYSFSLKGKLFSKKIPLAMESRVSDHYPFKDIMGGPTVVSNFGERHERDNFTEVPPSPASVCSSAQEEFWRPVDHLLSPLSTPDIITPCDEYALPRVFREINSNLTELRRQLNQLESDEPPEEEKAQPDPPTKSETLVELNDPAEAYVRDLLVASGLYNGQWETVSNPVSVSVFEQVEECYKKLAKDHESSSKDHKLLHDLLNEALSTVLRQPSSSPSMSLLLKPLSSFTTMSLRGKELLQCVWEIISQQLQAPCDRSSVSLADDLVARDLKSRRWCGGATDEIVTCLGREIESLVMQDLVEEILVDLKTIS